MILSFVDEIAWVKCNRSKRMAKSHGFYLQHSKETCFVAKIVVLTGLFDVGKSSSTHELWNGIGRDLFGTTWTKSEAS